MWDFFVLRQGLLIADEVEGENIFPIPSMILFHKNLVMLFGHHPAHLGLWERLFCHGIPRLPAQRRSLKDDIDRNVLAEDWQKQFAKDVDAPIFLNHLHIIKFTGS
jgi:hypothetical protein